MRRSWIFGLALTASAGLVGPAHAEDLVFTLVNGTSSTLTAFHVSHTGTDEWEENLLRGRRLRPGQEATVVIADGRADCEYDIRAGFADDGDVEEFGVDLCDLETYTLED